MRCVLDWGHQNGMVRPGEALRGAAKDARRGEAEQCKFPKCVMGDAHFGSRAFTTSSGFKLAIALLTFGLAGSAQSMKAIVRWLDANGFRAAPCGIRTACCVLADNLPAIETWLMVQLAVVIACQALREYRVVLGVTLHSRLSTKPLRSSR